MHAEAFIPSHGCDESKAYPGNPGLKAGIHFGLGCQFASVVA